MSRDTKLKLFELECLGSFWFYLNEAKKMEKEKTFHLKPLNYLDCIDPGLDNWSVVIRPEQRKAAEEVFVRQKKYPQEKKIRFTQEHLEKVTFSCNMIATEFYKKRWRK